MLRAGRRRGLNRAALRGARPSLSTGVILVLLSTLRLANLPLSWKSGTTEPFLDADGHPLVESISQKLWVPINGAQQGMIIRMPTNDVRSIGRATQGVRLIEIEGEDRVVSVARLVEKDENGEEGPRPS